MKRLRFIVLALSTLLCIALTGCSESNDVSVISDAIPEEITSIEVSGFYGGGELNPRELTQEEIQGLNVWLSELSLTHRTYIKGEAPNEVWNGGTSYRFNVNDGEMPENQGARKGKCSLISGSLGKAR